MKTYELIFNDIKEKIENGIYQPEEKLPSLREFSKIYQSTPVTIKKSLSVLEDIGYVHVKDRVGFFVASYSIKPHLLYFHDSKSLINMHDQKIVNITTLSAEKVANEINQSIPQNTRCLKMTRLWYSDELPIAVNTIYLPHKKATHLARKDISRLQEWLDLVLNNYDVSRKLTISLASATHASREVLYLNEQEPVFCFTQSYHTIKKQLAGFSLTFTPCSEINLKMKY